MAEYTRRGKQQKKGWYKRVYTTLQNSTKVSEEYTASIFMAETAC
jgi:hypothetical protein